MKTSQRNWGAIRRLWWCGGITLLVWLVHASEGACPCALAAQDAPPQPPSAERVQAIPSAIVLRLGEVRSLGVEEIRRIVVGNPEIVDVTVPASNEVLLQANSSGTTNLIVWDQQGQHVVDVEVVDRAPEVREAQLSQLLHQLNVPDVRVSRENGTLFLAGSVDTQSEFDRVEQMLAGYPGVTNLVAAPPLSPAPTLQPLVKLTVQIIEMNRKDLEKLGVKWSESVAITQPAATDRTLNEALWRWGTGLSRGSVAATINALVEQNRARILSEPKLVTASGKEASSFIGLEVPIVTATSFSTTTSASSASIEFRKTGVLLKMTPNVHAGGSARKITTVIEAEISGIDDSVALQVPVGNQTVSVPGFSVRKANTEVTTTSGETIMIAGLLSAADSDTISQVPALGSMPVFGRLFRSPVTESKRQELVIVVTPELLGDTISTTEKSTALERVLAVPGSVGRSPGGLRHSLAGEDIAGSVEDPTLRYALQVQDRIAKSLQYPVHEKGLGRGGQVKLRLRLLRDGTLGQALIAESSGIGSLDEATLRVAQQQSPYPPFPPDLLQQELWLELPVQFRP